MTYQCDKHPGQSALTDYCPDCMEVFANRRNPDEMTGDQRAAEFRWWGTILTIPFDNLHQRIQELVGRPVWTHELAGRAAVDLLIEEARIRKHPTMAEILDKLPQGKRVIVIDTTHETQP